MWETQQTWVQSLIPGSGRSPGGGNCTPLQYSCWDNPTDREVWWTYSPRGHKGVGHDLVTNTTTDILIFTAPGPSTRQVVRGHWMSTQVASSFILPLLISDVLIWVRVHHVKGMLRQDLRGQSISGAQKKKCAPGTDLVF